MAAALVMFGVLAAAVSLANDSLLGNIVGAVLTLQQVVVVGRFASSELPGTIVSDIFNALSIFNFDINYIKLGCTVNRVEQKDVFIFTLAIIGVALVCFFIASLFRAVCRGAGQLAATQLCQ